MPLNFMEIKIGNNLEILKLRFPWKSWHKMGKKSCKDWESGKLLYGHKILFKSIA